MAVLLGIDTGGTFTDAVLIREDPAGSFEIVSTAKSPTTHAALSVGVAEVLGTVLSAGGVDPTEVGLVSLSTTLATNALVEGHGDPVAMIAAGFDAGALARAGVASVVPADLFVEVAGGHDAHGNELTDLAESAVAQAAERLSPAVGAFAVVAQFSVRNPVHEQRMVDLVRVASGRPVTASHHLSARLDGPRRALTAALNARLLGTIARLHAAVESVLGEAGVAAPLMVVRGDGSLVSSAFATERPIETVLSGPAASVIGARHLAGVTDGIVADVGGTTTDVAMIRAGRPSIADAGATVGGHHTMVEAVELTTIGLGGDSEVRIDHRHRHGPLVLGPGRAVPIGRLALEHPQIVDELKRQLADPARSIHHGRFVLALADRGDRPLDGREERVLHRVTDGPRPEAAVVRSGLDASALARLRSRGLVRVATLTPTDASTVLGAGPAGLDGDACALVAAVLARQSAARGGPMAPTGEALAALVVEAMVERSAAFVLGVALACDGIDVAEGEVLVAASLGHHRGAVDVNIALSDPITAIGAPAPTFYPGVAERLRTPARIPDHAEVANAVGAVVGQVTVRRSCTVTQPSKGQFRVHLDGQPTFGSVDNARRHAGALLDALVRADADRAGAAQAELRQEWSETTAVVEGKQVFVEGTLTVEASGRPRI